MSRVALALPLALLLPRLAIAQTCGDGAIAATEGCDDGNLANGDGCAMDCTVEPGWFCVPSLHASGVNPAGVALAAGSTDPHWVWSLSSNGANATPGYVARNPAWASLPPGNWVTTDANFGNGITSGPDTFWFQEVFMPSTFAGNLTFSVEVAADNQAEVFVNGVSYGGVVGFGSAGSVQIPSSAFVAGNNVVSIRLIEYVPGTPRGILMYPGGGGILSQCAPGCTTDLECDDNNPCTDDTCIADACHFEPLPLGTTCTSTSVCGRAEPLPFCVGCVDTNTTTTSTTIDVGCDAVLPFCDESGAATCVQCETADHCGGLPCVDGICGVPMPDAGMPDSGSPDAGEPRDGGDDRDGGSARDAGDARDSGAIDAGALDAAANDAGTVDSGTIPRDAGPPRDAGAAPDAGATLDEGEDSCDCATSRRGDRGGLFVAPLVLIALLSRRRRAR